MKIRMNVFAAMSFLLLPPAASAQMPPEAAPPAQRIDIFAIPWCGLNSTVTQRPEGPDLVASLESFVTGAIARRDFKSLREMFGALNSPACLFADGQPRLMTFGNGLGRYFSGAADWSKSSEVVDSFRQGVPKEPITALLEANYWLAYAWNARGRGYAGSVSPDGWRLFHERLARAAQVLNESKDYAASSPLWYELMLEVASLAGAPESDRAAIFAEGVEKFDWYLPLYFTQGNFLLPRWGGSWESVDRLAAWSVDKTRARLGDSMYARIYWAAAGNRAQRENIFKETRVTWPKMKKGFQDLMKQFPQSHRNLNAFARFACEAGDRQTYASLRKLIGSDFADDIWADASRHTVCDAKFGYGQSMR